METLKKDFKYLTNEITKLLTQEKRTENFKLLSRPENVFTSNYTEPNNHVLKILRKACKRQEHESNHNIRTMDG